MFKLTLICRSGS